MNWLSTNSLGLRLLVPSLLWIALTLAIAGFLLTALFRAHIESHFDGALREHLEELVAASEPGAKGDLKLTWSPADPRFNRPRSGWYWQIRDGETVLLQSPSSRYETLSPPLHSTIPPQTALHFTGPGNEPLRAVIQSVQLPEFPRAFSFLVSGPQAEIQREVLSFATRLAGTLTLLGLGLIGAVLLQLRFGLHPFRTLRTALADIRGGSREFLPEDFPREVKPLVQELNALLKHNTALVARARTQASNLTHALKNPLTVIRNEARELPGTTGKYLRDQAGKMSDTIDRYRARARLAGTGNVLGARTSFRETVDELCFSFELLYRDRNLRIEVTSADTLYFRGDAQDLEELLGNLMDNACKWARSEVRICGWGDEGQLHICVDDDGPGIAERERQQALQRGHRLDESVPGSGLGLDIVQDIVTLYRGKLALEKSTLGGLKVELTLPAAE